jgi:pyruvate,water dikinase
VSAPRVLQRVGERVRAALRQRKRDSVQMRRYDAAFRFLYQRFREILALNDATLELIADIEERLACRGPVALAAMERRVRKASLDVFVMVKDLNQIAQGSYGELYGALRRLNAGLERELEAAVPLVGCLVEPLRGLRAGAAPNVGAKMANLGEAARLGGFEVPRGFAITTVAVARFLAGAGLWERCEGLEEILERDGPQALLAISETLGREIAGAQLPDEVTHAVSEAVLATFGASDVRLAVRSSAVGEDSAGTSHAGLYETVLDVPASSIGDAYRTVVASAFSSPAVAYRLERGLPLRESLMAVGCVEMVTPRCSGILYSRPPDDPGAGEVVISVTPGVGAAVAAGELDAVVARLTPGRGHEALLGLMSGEEADGLYAVARRLEAHFGSPQDVEWAIDGAGRLVVLQSRPVAAARMPGPGEEATLPAGQVLLAGGYGVFAGVAAGPVVSVRDARDLAVFPVGGVLVALHSSPAFAAVMGRCAAIVTDVGSPTGHMASLAREFAIPTIVGAAGALATLAAGRMVTVDARRCRVLDGGEPRVDVARRERVAGPDSPALARLRRLGRLVTPLTLTDATSSGFAPEACSSLHDITRFVHEKAYDVMFHYGDVASEDRHHSFRLDARLPIVIRVFDVGGGISTEKQPGGRVRPEEITSVPLRWLLAGLLEPRIRWDQPRPVSVRGFLSVLSESVAGPPPEIQHLGRLSYAIVSDQYLNFSTKAGYHFQTVDAYCGASQNKNYVHFRFHGGAADAERRARRVKFLSAVLTALDFAVVTRGDMLTARFDKYPADAIGAKLAALGRLTLCARQLDMLMDSDAHAGEFARAFLAGEWEHF